MKSSKVSRLSIQFQDVPTEKCVPVPVKVQWLCQLLQFSFLNYCSLAKLAIFWALQVEGQSCVNVPTQKCESVPVQVIGHGGHVLFTIYIIGKKGRFIQEVSNLSMGILSGRYWIAFTGITLSCQPELPTSWQSWGWQFWVYPLLRIAKPSYDSLSSLTGDI